jgi:chaperone required for assembly of F1-ATPase
MRRTYQSVTVDARDGAHVILLDGKPSLTPKKNLLALPTRALAKAVADEWREQAAKVDPRRMPLTRLANTAIDLADRHATIGRILEYGPTDLLLYRAEETALAERQANAWDPLLAWAQERFGVTLTVSSGITPVEQPAEALEALRAIVEGHDAFALITLSSATTITTSLILALAIADGRLSVGDAFALSQLDERYQAERWGNDRAAELRAGALADELQLVGDFLNLCRS